MTIVPILLRLPAPCRFRSRHAIPEVTDKASGVIPKHPVGASRKGVALVDPEIGSLRPHIKSLVAIRVREGSTKVINARL